MRLEEFIFVVHLLKAQVFSLGPRGPSPSPDSNGSILPTLCGICRFLFTRPREIGQSPMRAAVFKDAKVTCSDDLIGRIYTSAICTDVESIPTDTLQLRFTHGHMLAYGDN